MFLRRLLREGWDVVVDCRRRIWCAGLAIALAMRDSGQRSISASVTTILLLLRQGFVTMHVPVPVVRLPARGWREGTRCSCQPGGQKMRHKQRASETSHA